MQQSYFYEVAHGRRSVRNGIQKMTDSKPRIAAGGVFSDSWDVIPLVIGNLILGGIKDFFFILHNSTDNFTEELQDLFRDSANIHFVIKPSEPFFQGTMMTFLANWARREGFEIFVPTDSDEFLLTETEEIRAIASLTKWQKSERSRALRVSMLNYVQDNSVSDFNATSAQYPNYLALPRSEAMSQTKEAVLKGGSVVNKGTESKVIFKLSRGVSVEVGEGSHYILGGGTYLEGDAQSDLYIAHLPYRSKNSIKIKKRLGINRISADFDKDSGWQNQMLVKMDDAKIEEFWGQNSYVQRKDGSVTLAVGKGELKFDDRLTRAINKVLTTFDYKNWIASVDKSTRKRPLKDNLNSETSLVLDVFGTHIRELNSSAAFNIHAVMTERDAAVAERVGAVAAAKATQDAAVIELNAAVQERERLVAEAISHRDVVVAERNSAVIERNISVQERNISVQERNAAVQERNAAVEERNAAVSASNSERDAAVAERNAAVAERDAAVAERNAAVTAANTERDAAVAERNAAVTAANTERDAAVAERNAILNSTIWKSFKPYRAVLKLIKRG